MSYPRTDEHRRASAERARRHRPWTRSTGPTTDAGKAVSRMNRYRGAVRPTLREIARLLREQERQRREIGAD